MPPRRASTGRPRLHRLLLKYVISIALGVLMVWLAFRGEDWQSLGARLETVQPGPAWGYLGLFALAHLLRIQRWGLLVRALGPISWRSVFSAGAIGYMCITAFPLRLGEFVRPYLVRGQGGVTASGALATVVVERVIDGVLFVGLFFVFIALLPESGHPAVGAVKVGAYMAGLFFVTLLVVLIAAYKKQEATIALLSGIGRRIHAGLTERAVGLLRAFLDGLKVLPDRRRLVAFLAVTVVYWALQGWGVKLVADACSIPDMTWTGSFALLTVVVVGIMIPAGPGFTGSFELAVKASFALLVLAPESRENMLVFTVMLHLPQVVVQLAFGLAWMLGGQVRLGRVVRESMS